MTCLTFSDLAAPSKLVVLIDRLSAEIHAKCFTCLEIDFSFYLTYLRLSENTNLRGSITV